MIFHKQIFNVQFGTRSVIIGTGHNFLRLNEAISDVAEGTVPTPDDVNQLAPEINLFFPTAASVEPLINELLKLKDKLAQKEISQQILEGIKAELDKQALEEEACGCGDPDCDNEASLAGDEEPS